MAQFQSHENDLSEATTTTTTTAAVETLLLPQQQSRTPHSNVLCPQLRDHATNTLAISSINDIGDAVIIDNEFVESEIDSSTETTKITVGNLQATPTTSTSTLIKTHAQQQERSEFPETQEFASTSAAAIAAMNAACTVSADAAVIKLSSPLALECPICLQSCIHPARLPCGHIFCFLCVKGVASKNRRCAMCRREIPVEFLEHPQLVNGIEDIRSTKTTEDGYQWFYEGRNGWWQYDDRTSQDIEEAFKKGEKSCTILVAGYVYIVDLESLIQQRQNEPARCRHVKRDLASIPKKGVAGLRIEGDVVTAESSFANFPQTNLAHAVYARHPNRRLQHFYINMHTNAHLLHNIDTDEEDDDNEPSNNNFVGFNRPMLDFEDDDDYNNEFDMNDRSTLSSLSNLTNPLSDFMPRLEATTAAISINSDIIDSTSAHVDDMLPMTVHGNGVDVNETGISTTAAVASSLQGHIASLTSKNPISAQHTHGEHASNSNAKDSSISSDASAITRNNDNNLCDDVNLSDTTLAESNIIGRQNIITQANATSAVANNHSIDLFEQTLTNFHSLNLHNTSIVDDSISSSDEATDNNNDADQGQNLQGFAHNTQFHF